MRCLFIVASVLISSSLVACGPNNDVEKSPQTSKNVKVPESYAVSEEKTLTGFWMRTSEQPILPDDPKMAVEFLDLLESETTSYFTEMNSQEYDTPAEKLGDMVHIDQTMRNMSIRSSIIASHFPNAFEREAYAKGRLKIFYKVDESNTAILKSMLEGRGWFRDDVDGEGAAHSGWLIAQHADQNAGFQRDVLKKMEAELGSPGVTKALYAYLFDRVSVQPATYNENTKRTQRYGTQGRCNFEKEIWEPLPLEDEDRVDRWRAQMGLEHLDDYKIRFNCQRREDGIK